MSRAVEVAPLLGEGAWGNLRGDFATVTFSDYLHTRKSPQQVDLFRVYKLIIHPKTIY